jgi:hypothetical protein
MNELIKLVSREDRNKNKEGKKEKRKRKNLANVTGHLSKSNGLQALGSLNM